MFKRDTPNVYSKVRVIKQKLRKKRHSTGRYHEHVTSQTNSGSTHTTTTCSLIKGSISLSQWTTELRDFSGLETERIQARADDDECKVLTEGTWRCAPVWMLLILVFFEIGELWHDKFQNFIEVTKQIKL